MSFLTDSHLAVVPLVFEEPHSYVMSYEVDRLDSGAVAGTLGMPSSRERELFHIQGISDDTTLYSNVSSTMRSLMDYYLSGGQLRVYRLYPANLTAWSTDNEFGYSDIIQQSPGGGSYPWFNNKMTVFNFDIDGVSVD